MKKFEGLADVIVVGSGPAGAHATYPLVKAGLNVIMLDGGLDTKKDDVFNKTQQLLKIKSNIKIIQTLAKGGLSEVWPGISDYFTPEELIKTGLPADEIINEYKEVAKIIKLTIPNIDSNCKLLLSNKNVYPLPVAFPYRTLEEISKFSKFNNFNYTGNQLVVRVEEKRGFVEVISRSLKTDNEIKIRAKYLILAAGSLNTTRILLKSFNLYNYRTPFLTKNNYMFICLQPKMLINKSNSNSLNSGQVALSQDQFFTQLYRCSLKALDKALAIVPIPKKIASLLFTSLKSYLIVADVRFANFESKNRFLKLEKKPQGDVLHISFVQSKKELQKHLTDLNQIKKTLYGMGLIPIKMLRGEVTSHYAGGVPVLQKSAKLSVDAEGKLHQASRIYIADSATWRALSGKPPTLTIMANARRVAKNLLKNSFP